MGKVTSQWKIIIVHGKIHQEYSIYGGYPLVNADRKLLRITMLLMGKLTISMRNFQYESTQFAS